MRSSRKATRSGSGCSAHLLEGRAQERLARAARRRAGAAATGCGAASRPRSRRAPALEPRQQVPGQLVAERAQVGLVLQRVELRQAGLEGEERDAAPLRPRAQLLVERLGHQQDGRRLRRGRWRSARRRGRRGTRRPTRRAARGRRPAGTALRAAASRSISARAPRRGSRPARRRSRRRRAARPRRGRSRARRPRSSTAGPAAGALGAGGSSAGSSSASSSSTTSSSAAGAAKEASRAAAASRRSSSSLRREVEHQLLGVDAAGQHLAREVAPAERQWARRSRQVEGELALAQPHEPLEDRRRCAGARRARARGPGGWSRGSAGTSQT